MSVERSRHSGAHEYATNNHRTEAAAESMKAMVVREARVVMEPAMESNAMEAPVKAAANQGSVRPTRGSWHS
jgi:hypothetical protein